MGNTYIKITGMGFSLQPFAVRQHGNKLKGIVHDSINEFLLMDFDANVGDTIHNLYSEGLYYHAKVLAKDSVMLNSGVYHKFMNLEGIKILYNGSWGDYNWSITWNEKALCGWNLLNFDGENLGGVIFNIPSSFYVISIPYAYAGYCTTDTLYVNPIGFTCENCFPETNSIDENELINFQAFPNPTSDKLNITFSNEGYREISILNTFGQSMMSISIELSEIELITEELSSGIYIINVKTENSNSTKRFIKN
jgi:hypothetical protein